MPRGDHAIPLDFGNDGGGSDGHRERIAVNDWLLRKFAIKSHSIHQKVACRRRQLLNSMKHCKTRSLVDIDLIDAGGIHSGNCPSDAMLANQEREFFAALGGEQFGIAESPNAGRGIVVSIENDGSCDHWTEQRPAAHFIDSGNILCAGVPRPLFKLKSAAQFFQQAQLGSGSRNLVSIRTLRRARGI